MKTIIQRCKSASVTVDGQLISSISKGLLVFAAVSKDDTQAQVESMASKVLKVKLWNDGDAKWKKSVVDLDYEVLCVSQFTLLASTKKGNKPDFHKAAPALKGKELYDCFISKVRALYREDRVKDGVFQAMMEVSLVNDGPVGVDYLCEDEVVTIEIDTDPPDMEKVTEFEAPTEFDTFKGHMHKHFELPASLLE